MKARVVFVTGKGGTGKTTIASALAAEQARRGRPVLLLTMPPPTGLGSSPAAASSSGRPPASELLEERVLDERRDLEVFLGRVLGIESIARRLGRSRTFAAVAAAAPGLRDLVALGTVLAEAAAVDRSAPGSRLVIVDAPSTGHSVPMLAAPARALDLSGFGPVAGEARRMKDVLSDPVAFTALLVTTAEDLPVRETLSLHKQVASAGVGRTHVVVNALWPTLLSSADADLLTTSQPDSDAARHWRRGQRQARLAAHLERHLGTCSRVGFALGGSDLPPADVASLLDRLGGGPG